MLEQVRAIDRSDTQRGGYQSSTLFLSYSYRYYKYLVVTYYLVNFKYFVVTYYLVNFCCTLHIFSLSL